MADIVPDDVDEARLDAAVKVFKLLANPTRLRILQLLGTGKFNVNTIGARLGLEQPVVSHQLIALKLHGLVTSEVAGKARYYSLVDPDVLTIIRAAGGLL